MLILTGSDMQMLVTTGFDTHALKFLDSHKPDYGTTGQKKFICWFWTAKTISLIVRLLKLQPNLECHAWISLSGKDLTTELQAEQTPRRMCQLGLVKSFEIKKCFILLHPPHFFSQQQNPNPPNYCRSPQTHKTIAI